MKKAKGFVSKIYSKWKANHGIGLHKFDDTFNYGQQMWALKK